jgi:uncharacterized protein (DUF1015 family)
MAKIIPFRAVRPTQDKVSLVTCKTYDEYTQTELAAWLSLNPYSFLHVLNPAYINAQKLGTEKRFKGVKHKYDDFKEEKILVQDEKEAFYLYEIRQKNQTFTGIIAGISIEDYRNNHLKKHEDTLAFRVEILKDFLKQTRFNTEPVLITYPDKNEINTWIHLKKNSLPLYDFSTYNKERHLVWKIDTENEIDWLSDFFEQIPDLYIADGHHRSAAADLFATEKNIEKRALSNYFMTFLIAESQLKIYEYNRVVRDLNGFSKQSFLEILAQHFDIENKAQELWKPNEKLSFGMYLAGDFYSLRFKNTKRPFKNTLESLDAQVLYQYVLQPLLGIEDLRNDERIEYIPGNVPLVKMKSLIDEGEFEIGFLLFPSNVQEIKSIANERAIMPPKSTYIEPKFRNGMIIYEI